MCHWDKSILRLNREICAKRAYIFHPFLCVSCVSIYILAKMHLTETSEISKP
jgi:hypothetical protein